MRASVVLDPQYRHLFEPIPAGAGRTDGWKHLPIQENHDPLVPVGLGTDYHFYTSSVYFGEHTSSPYIDQPYEGSLLTMFMRRTTAGRLAAAQALLPQGYHMVIHDSYRPVAVQQALYERYDLALELTRPDLSVAERSKLSQQFVSLPSTDETRPSPHNTGGTVDVSLCYVPPRIQPLVAEALERAMLAANHAERTEHQYEAFRLIGKAAVSLDFGTPFDHGGPEAALRHSEERYDGASHPPAAVLNRRLLYHAMTAAGLQAYDGEWWHFNDELTQMGAVTAGLPVAHYGPMVLNEEQQAHEQWRVERRRSLHPKHHVSLLRRCAELVPPGWRD